MILLKKKKKSKIAVVTTAYKIPEKRVDAWLKWNEHYDVTFYIVTDKDYTHTHNTSAVILKWPGEPFSKFNLAKTSNYGIKTAIQDGYDIIIKTDIDCILSDKLMSVVNDTNDTAVNFPVYMMCKDEDSAKIGQGTSWLQTFGTAVATGNVWKKLCGYCELMCGYGNEDGDLSYRCKKIGIHSHRFGTVNHVAHEEKMKSDAGFRTDQWNRDTLNPLEHDHNVKYIGKWFDQDWGLGV